MTRCAVIVPVFNHLDLTKRFITNILQWLNPPHELVIVDNASTDGTRDWLIQYVQEAKPNVAVSVNYSRANLGFSGGNNLGYSTTPADVYIFTSNDVAINGDFITPVCAALQNVSMVGHKLHAENTGWNTFVGTDGAELTIPYLAGHFVAMSDVVAYLLSRDEHDKMLWDAELSPISDYEDVDLCYRAKLQGMLLCELPNLPIEHLGSGNTANHMGSPRIERTLAARTAFMVKHALTE